MQQVHFPAFSPFTGGGEESFGTRSAGDKAQDLLGIFANSPVGSTSELLGIQIPYHTFVTSDTVDPEVRNFFLTYGAVNPDEKTSEGNTREGSQPMDTISKRLENADGEVVEAAEEAEELETDEWAIVDFIDSVVDIASDILDDMVIILGQDESGNKGGIHIIPARLNLRYDAGESHYTYDMLLSAVNHKIAP